MDNEFHLNVNLSSVQNSMFTPDAIYCGDCLDVLRTFPEKCIDLIYLDPPFFSQRRYLILKQDRKLEPGFKDTWKGGIESYLSWMEARLRECFRVLKETGSLYLHCNSFANAHLRLLADDLFSQGIKSEIIWDKGFRGTERQRNWQQSHDTILFYTKSDKYVWNDQFQNYADPHLFRYNQLDDQGKKFALIKRRRTDGTVYYGKTYPKALGKKINDVIRIPLLSATSKERVGYPTQKPEALIERLILASSNPGDLVLDPVCGSGTSCVVAERLGRKWIGIDSSMKACVLAKKRIEELEKEAVVKILG